MMSEIEKLRALLAEARGVIDEDYDRGIPSITERIDAALAEPVVDDDIDADLRMHKEDRLRLRTENLRLTRERDEARAEAVSAFRRGAEAMREAAASYIGSDTALLQTYRSVLEGRIRDLPVPGDKK